MTGLTIFTVPSFPSFIPPTHTTPTLYILLYIINVGVVCVGDIKLEKLGTVNIVSPVNAQAVAMVIPKYPTSNTFRTRDVH